ncbi:MAG: serine hydroxymethyltransferase [Candidatus Brennerbacteria bacterium]|nr:serine hydroxymethyltransferase [Candidatus Brennerbacteria bacterium]
MFKFLKKSDPLLCRLITAEIKRQQETIDLIPSENIISPQLLEALGSPLANKYSEGYPGKRYYPGNKYYDAIENLAKERALKAFKLNPKKWHVNVQPYSGSPANLEIYSALMKPGEVLMGMSLFGGGHLTHGHNVNFSGRIYKSIQYGINQATGLINYREIERLAKKHKPRIIISGFTSYPRKVDFKKIGIIAKKVQAYHIADISHIAGLVAAGLQQSPFSYSDAVMATTHKTLRGPRGAIIFCKKELAELIDKAVFPGMQGGPHNHTIAAIAGMFNEALKPEFKKYQEQIIKNSQSLSRALIERGFDLITGGTDNHLMVIDLKNVGVDGMTAEKRLETIGILANRNVVPEDKSPFKPSGLRLGTPSVTSRGMKEREMVDIAQLVYFAVLQKEQVAVLAKKISLLAKKFPLRY